MPQQRTDQGLSKAMSEIEQATDDMDVVIDPSLRHMDFTSALTERLSHKHTHIQKNGPVQHATYMHPKGHESVSTSRVPISASSQPVVTSSKILPLM